LYLQIQFVQGRKRSASRLYKHESMLHTETVTVCSENHSKPDSTLRGQKVEFINAAKSVDT
jgi:hypothetical protein